MSESAVATKPAEAWVTEADRRDAVIARFVDEVELQAMKQYRRDHGVGVPHDVRLAKLLATIDNAPRYAEYRWRQTQRRIPDAVRAEILQDACAYCGEEATTVDHILPIIRGGTRDRDNLAAACWPCNQEKGGLTVAEWMKYRAEQGLPWPSTTAAFAELS
jgi:5-methylcytosine-specific restriction endonuclease McrA